MQPLGRGTIDGGVGRGGPSFDGSSWEPKKDSGLGTGSERLEDTAVPALGLGPRSRRQAHVPLHMRATCPTGSLASRTGRAPTPLWAGRVLRNGSSHKNLTWSTPLAL